MASPLLLLLLALQAQSAADWKQLGLRQIAAGQRKLATEALEKACALEPAPGDSCFYLARNYNSLNEFEDARRAFGLALAKAPADLKGRVLRATALNDMALGKNAEAEAHFQSAIAADPSGAAAVRTDYGAFLFRQGRLADSVQVLRLALKADTESARANFELGRVLLQTGDLEEAAQRLETAVRRAPTDWNAHLLLGRAYQRLGRDADADRELRLGEAEWRRRQR